MAKQPSASESDKSLTVTNVQYGEFPFPLIDGPIESRYLTWLRNHSNYMAVRGLLDYLRSVGVLVRGIIVNFLIFLPYLLIVAIVLGYSHHQMLDHPFLVTLVVLVFALAWILLFPILMPLFKIFSYKRSLETGSESTVKQRDLYERSFGGLLLVILAVALLESLPWLLELFHDLLHSENFGWQGSVATVTGALAFLSGADKILSSVSGAKKAVAMVLIGIVGLLVPLMVILYATDFLLYGPPPGPTVMYSPLLVAVVGVLAILIAIPLGLSRRAFSLKECAAVSGMLVAGLILSTIVIVVINVALQEGEKAFEEKLPKIIDPLQRVASAFDDVSNKQEMTDEVAVMVDEVVIAEREYQRTGKEVTRDAEKFFDSNRRPDRGASDDLTIVGWCRDFIQKWRDKEQFARWNRAYFAVGQRFITLGDKLSEQPPGSLEPLRREIAQLAHEKLLEELEKKTNEDGDFVALLRAKLVERHLVKQLQFDPPTFAETLDTQDSEGGSFDREVDHVRNRIEQLSTHIANKKLVEKATVTARTALEKSSVEEIAKLLTEKQLYDRVETKFANVHGKAELARVVGKEELAKLLTKKEIVDLVVPPKLDEKVAVTLTRRFAKYALPGGMRDLDDQKRRAVAGRLAVLANFNAQGRPTANEEPGEKSATAGPAAEPAKVDRNETTVTSLENLDDEEIANLAGERLAELALKNFRMEQLAGVAVEYSKYGIHSVFFMALMNVSEDEEEIFKGLEKDARDMSFGRLTERVFARGSTENQGAILSSHAVQRPQTFSTQDIDKLLLAKKALQWEEESLAKLARELLVEKAENPQDAGEDFNVLAYSVLGYGFETKNDKFEKVMTLSDDELARIAVDKFTDSDPDARDQLVSTLVFGKYGTVERGELGTNARVGLANVKEELTEAVILPKAVFIFLLAAVIGLAGWLTVDVNLTSIHGLYRDRLASAFLVGQDTKGDVDIEQDVDLADLCRYEARSVAPYHLVNAALNLQGSKDIGIRERNSDCFIFSKRFIGGQRTGYCRSDVMDQVYPQMSLATAMAISAAAASPNMGRGTSPLLVAFMALLNIRLGYWMPNPGLLEEKLNKPHWKRRKKDPNRARDPIGFTFDEVFAEELKEIQGRWSQVYSDSSKRQLHLTADEPTVTPTTEHGLVGIGFSGGGIRSASINLGIAQTLHKRGAFDHVDYMSTVSGGGYLGSSISTLMRSREKLVSEIDGTVSIEPLELVSAIDGTVSKYVNVVVTSGEDVSVQRTYRFSADAELNVYDKENISAGTPLLKPRATKNQSEIAGTANANNRERTVKIQGVQSNENREYRFSKFDWLIVKTGDVVKAGNELIQRHNTVGERFRWRVRPSAFLREMCSKLDETHDWVNVSDGGHIENLATIELLRRRCKYIIIGDGEADPKLHFAGLATLMRTAYIDLGVKIKIDLDDLRLRKANEEDDEPTVSNEHWAIGKITYPKTSEGGNDEEGYLLYLKSSFTGDEIEVIREYRQRNPTFPHQSTADQMFDEGQFEAYRALGQHIGEQALKAPGGAIPAGKMAFGDLKRWFEENWKAKEERADEKVKKK